MSRAPERRPVVRSERGPRGAKARRCIAAAVAAFIAAAAPRLAVAQSAEDLRLSAARIAASIAELERTGKLDRNAQQRAIEDLGPLALAFFQLSDRAVFAGGSGQQGEALRRAYLAISEPLQAIYNKNNADLQASVQKVIEEDGDLEALQDSEPYRAAQLVASQALYFLNWLHYYGARLYEGQGARELLDKARRGFSEFAVADQPSDLTVESLLGRGLCHLELGEIEFAVHDLSAVVRDTKASPERRTKARFALLDAHVRSRNVKQALPLSEELLATTRGDEANWVRFLRIRALLDAARKTAGPEGERHRQLALAMMDQLRQAGGAWADRVTALAQTEIENPEEWLKKATSPFAKWELAKLLMQKNDHATALPLLQDVVRSQDPSLESQKREAHYLLGLAQFKAGEYLEAADSLEGALRGSETGFAADASYLRFKALEAAVAADPTAVEPERYEDSLRTFLDRYPRHASAFEARYRLGELLQAQGRFQQAKEAYAEVKGDPSFELQALFATLQCSFELLGGATREAERRTLLAQIGEELDNYEEKAAAYEARPRAEDPTPVKQMRAKVAIMKAVYVKLQPPVNHKAVLAALSGFEERYGPQEELLPQVIRLRLEAYLPLGRFEEARAQVAAGPDAIARLGAAEIERLAVSYLREGARRSGRGDGGANDAAQQVARAFYEILARDESGSSRSKLTLARLYENTGELDKARALYAEVMQAKGESTSALRGLGRIAERQGQLEEALQRWQTLVAGTRPGDYPWYEGSYEVARLTATAGRTGEACTQLERLKPAMPGLSDTDLRAKLDSLYRDLCK